MLSVSIFETTLGWVAVAGTAETVHHIWIGSQNEQDIRQRVSRECKWTRDGHIRDWYPELRKDLLAYSEGEPVEFRQYSINRNSSTPFRQRVLDVTRTIPHGTTLSYQQVAGRAGSPKAFRAVGNVMAQNRVPILIPCHRVVGASGQLRGFSAPTGVRLKEQLLALEQVGNWQSQSLLSCL